MPLRCVQPVCRFGSTRHLRRTGTNTPGNCCDVYECVQPKEENITCLVDGDVLQNGSIWWKNECTQCKCNNGLVLCAETFTPEMQCPKLPADCRATRMLPDTCCPDCVGHEDSDENTGALPDGCISPTGKVLQNGEDWQDDPCTTCTCIGGVKKCQAYMCVVRCEHPLHVHGECCPLCDSTSVVTLPPHCPSLSNCSLRCLHGFVRNDDGCYTCQCQVEECVLECPDGYLQDSHGNKLCECDSSNLKSTDCPALSDCRKNCSHGFRLNKAGCEVCKCKECRPLTDCNKNCTYGLRTNDRGCPICKCQAVENFPEPVSTNHIITERTCISAVGQHHDDGETWFDGCRLCYCHGGTEMCNLISCPVLTCSNPIFNSTQDCCPHCPDSKFQQEHSQAMVCHSVDGAYRVEGETWLLDACTKCICHMGRVLCEINQCPPVPCSKPIYKTGQCCPQCPELPSSMQITELEKSCESHSHGSMWMENNCRSCICVDGKTSCFVQQCQNVACNRPVLAKHQCCPMCLEPIDSESESIGDQPLGLFMESTYIVIILILLCITTILALYMGHNYCRNRQQLKLTGTPKSCPNPVYHDYAHTDSYPPPHYNSSDHHRSKVDPYQYRYVPTYDSQQINDMLKSSSIGVTEKTALAPV
ncbi:hypothetical protein C0J52_26083 [Blattella germanica]|nr:hypothetical protein C0J52_26083 [Blattella germanica]